jgi:hypothetical protein
MKVDVHRLIVAPFSELNIKSDPQLARKRSPIQLAMFFISSGESGAFEAPVLSSSIVVGLSPPAIFNKEVAHSVNVFF